jgi:RING-type zinc-finger
LNDKLIKENQILGEKLLHSQLEGKISEVQLKQASIDIKKHRQREEDLLTEKAALEHSVEQLTKQAKTGLKNNYTCSICLENLFNMALTCGHVYCDSCLSQWKKTKKQKNNQKIKCPQCNQKSKVLRLYH